MFRSHSSGELGLSAIPEDIDITAPDLLPEDIPRMSEHEWTPPPLNGHQPPKYVYEEEKKLDITINVMPTRKDVSAEWIESLKPAHQDDCASYGYWRRNVNPDFSALFNKLREHKCEHRLNDNGSVTFFPSPYLSHSELGCTPLQKVPFTRSIQFRYSW